MTDFDKIPEYTAYNEKDEYRSGLHYPAVERELGELRGSSILDVGCDDGLFSRRLAAQGASVFGYDISAEQIAKAQQHPDARRLNVAYMKATPQEFSDSRSFDAATSTMVLPYADNVIDLTAFFRNTHQHLTAGGKFVSVILNPLFTEFHTNFIVRRITKLDGNRVQQEFLHKASGEPALSSPLFKRQYTKDEYERAAAEAGMTFEWKTLTATPEAIAREGEPFWRPVHETQLYSLFIAQKK